MRGSPMYGSPKLTSGSSGNCGCCGAWHDKSTTKASEERQWRTEAQQELDEGLE